MNESLYTSRDIKVSVCIPTYNQASFIEAATRSVLQQTYNNIEIIISDDGSTDKTPDIIQRLVSEIPTLISIRQKQNLGLSKNVDACMRSATGEFVVRLDSDDRLSPQYVEKLVKLLLQYPEAGYAHAGVQEIDQQENFIRSRRLFRKTGFQSGDDALKVAIYGYKVAANILMFRRTALEKVNFLAGRPNFGEDYHLTASLSSAGFGNVYLNEVLSFYRIWIDEGRERKKRKITEIAGIRQVFEEVLEPAFEERKWRVIRLNNCKTNFACGHADCLGWKVYNKIEKQELSEELCKLSSAFKVKLYSWLYINGFGPIITLIVGIKSFSKSVLKKVYLYLQH